MTIQVGQNVIEHGEMEHLFGQFAREGDPAHDVRLQHGDVTLDGVLVQDGQRRLRQFARPLRRRVLAAKRMQQFQNVNNFKQHFSS